MPFGNAELLATKNDLIISLVQRELISKAVVMPTLRDASAFAGKGMKSINVPRAGSFAVEDRATTAPATLVNVTYATDPMQLSQMSTVSWVTDPQDEIESSIAVEQENASRAARAQAKNFDTLTIAGLEADSTATTTAGAITKDIVLEMRESLLTAEADSSQLTLLVGPDSEHVLLNIAEFVEPDKYGSAVIPSGVLGRLYGVKVVMSTQIAASTYYMYDSDGYGFAFQRSLNLGEAPDIQYGSTAVRKTMDMKWGHAKLQNGLLLRKDNN